MKQVKFIKLLNETIHLSKISTKINIVMSVDKSEHAEKRRSRDNNEDNKSITNDEISNTMKAALPKIVEELIGNTLNIRDRVIIQNTKTDLNIVVIIKANSSNKDEIDCVVLTVMRIEKFQNKYKTVIIKVSV